MIVSSPAGPGVIKLEHSLKLKIKRNDWLIADIDFEVILTCFDRL